MASRRKACIKEKGIFQQVLFDQIVCSSEKVLNLLDECQGRWKKAFIKLNSIIRSHKSEVVRLKNLQDHTENMLKTEVQKRRRVEQSKRSMEKKINLIRRVLMENDVDAARKQIEAMEVPNTSPRRSSINPAQLDRSAGSLLDPMNVSGENVPSVRFDNNGV